MKKLALFLLLLAVPAVAQQSTIPNESSTGTLVNRLVKLTGNPATAIITATTDTAGIEGPCVSGCGTAGNAIIAKVGNTLLAFDGPAAPGDYIQQSTTGQGQGHDAGNTCPST